MKRTHIDCEITVRETAELGAAVAADLEDNGDSKPTLTELVNAKEQRDEGGDSGEGESESS